MSEIRFDMPALNIIVNKNLVFVFNFYLDSLVQISEGAVDVNKLELAKSLFQEHLYNHNFKETSSKYLAQIEYNLGLVFRTNTWKGNLPILF